MISTSPFSEMSEATSVLEIIPPDSSQHDTSLIILFFALQLIGLVGSIFTIVIAHFSPIRRHLTWYNFLASWIISSLSYSLLLFAGQIDLSGEKKSEVPFGLCVFQSSVIYASPPLLLRSLLFHLIFSLSCLIFYLLSYLLSSLSYILSYPVT
ncbi:hypothetical protein C8R41DRAFT_292069 [Lentinula lateritia]|uniref:G-protein coupled receptors family 1 profile domain-containing protein n=1 Tax=Lentinula lateritia TaxID=40482 RepID=A0ABQ8VNH8_9AGAR|nr:hypothetical protein C8R41DRAFT_292069 [Lentinula lateritia]